MTEYSFHAWPEPVVRVQSLSQSGSNKIPERYIKPPSLRPSPNPIPNSFSNQTHPNTTLNKNNNIPVIDFQNLFSNDQIVREKTMSAVSEACREWGFFQIVNHGVSHEMMKKTRDTWREFFDLPVEVKQEHANLPSTYEGYGSRLGIEKGAILDWSDYYFLHFMPLSLRNPSKWPSLPQSCRELIGEYGEGVVDLCGKLMKVLSINLGLKEDYLQNAFGGEKNIGACLRVNFYPKCPQPDLTLGLSSHSDPGGLTLLLPDEHVPGLQILRANTWVTVKPLPNAFIVNIGDQIQVVSNAINKSVEHRVIVNSEKDRLSLAFFYNPKSDLLIQPAKELVSEESPPLYPPLSYDQYRLFIRTKGPCGKSQVDSLRSPS